MSKIFNGKIISWALFDLGNTAYSALIVTIFLPVLITNFLGGNDFQLGLVTGLSLLFSALIVPFVGGISDATNIKRPFLILFSISCIFFTIMIASFNILYLSLAFALLANLCYHVSLDIYDSYLPNLTDQKYYGIVSGIGTAFGYVGTLLSLLMVWIIHMFFANDTLVGTRIIFPATAFFFLFFSIPIFFIRDPERKNRDIAEGAIISLKEVLKTIKGIKRYKNIWLFLLASLIYVDALNTSIIFLFRFGQEELGITISQFLPIFAVMAICSIIGSLIFGHLNDLIGPKKTLITALIIWIMVISTLIIDTNFITYLMTGMVGGALLGAIWTSTRPMLIHIAPKEKLTELFGFQGLTEKFGSAIGPIVYGALAVSYGHRAAIGSILVFFVMGLIVLSMVKEIEHVEPVEDY